jgi:hypothetical protein
MPTSAALKHIGRPHDLDHQIGADVARPDHRDLGLHISPGSEDARAASMLFLNFRLLAPMPASASTD